MALISCPECGQSVSSMAETCPHCGVSLVAPGYVQQPNAYYQQQQTVSMSIQTQMLLNQQKKLYENDIIVLDSSLKNDQNLKKKYTITRIICTSIFFVSMAMLLGSCVSGVGSLILFGNAILWPVSITVSIVDAVYVSKSKKTRLRMFNNDNRLRQLKDEYSNWFYNFYQPQMNALTMNPDYYPNDNSPQMNQNGGNPWMNQNMNNPQFDNSQSINSPVSAITENTPQLQTLEK